MTSRQIIVPDALARLHRHTGRAAAVLSGGLVFCAGLGGIEADSLRVPADPEAQFALAWRHAGLLLEAAGCNLDDVVDVASFHLDLDRHLGLFRTVMARHLAAPMPAWTAVGVAALSPAGLLAEVKLTARRRDTGGPGDR